MRTGLLMALLGAVVGCGSGGGGGVGGQGGTGGAGGSGGSGGALAEPVTCESMCHHVYWGCGTVLVLAGEILNSRSECVSACEGGWILDATVQCLGTTHCNREDMRVCFEPRPDPTCDNVCYLGDYCYIMDGGICQESCRAGHMSQAQRECLIIAGIQCNPRAWAACLE